MNKIQRNGKLPEIRVWKLIDKNDFRTINNVDLPFHTTT